MNFEGKIAPEAKEETGEIRPEEAVIGEQKTLLARMREAIRERAKPFIMALSLMTLSAHEMTTNKNAEAQRQPDISTEQKEQTPPAPTEREKKIMTLGRRMGADTWERLLSAKDNPAAINEAQNKSMKERVIRTMIQQFAGYLKVMMMDPDSFGKAYKEGGPGRIGMGGIRVTPDDTNRALGALNDSLLTLCHDYSPDQRVCNVNTLNSINDQLHASAAGKVFREMLIEFEKK